MSSSIVPTARTLACLALFAPLALIIAAIAPGAWLIAPIAALALLALASIDGWRAGKLTDIRLVTPADAEVGRDAPILLHAEIARRSGTSMPEVALGFDPQLGGRGVLQFPLRPTPDDTVFTGEATIVPQRRGTASLHALWVRWRGPLGLGERRTHMDLARQVRVWPDLSPARSPQLQAYLRDAQFGIVNRRIRGQGSQFEALVEYEAGMDRRRIDWKASARHNQLYARETEAERDNQIVFAFDCGFAMCSPVDGLPRIDRAISAGLAAAYVALKGGDRVALYGFAQRPVALTPFVNDARAFNQLQRAAAAFDYNEHEPNFTLALATLTARLQRRTLIVLFSDFADPTSAELMLESVGRLIRHHLVIFVTLTDTELDDLAQGQPKDIADVATAVAADALARQRALVLQRLRRLGVDVIEAPHEAVGFRLIDRYLEIKQRESIG